MGPQEGAPIARARTREAGQGGLGATWGRASRHAGLVARAAQSRHGRGHVGERGGGEEGEVEQAGWQWDLTSNSPVVRWNRRDWKIGNPRLCYHVTTEQLKCIAMPKGLIRSCTMCKEHPILVTKYIR
jgi:hypothetical protein